uniref:Uncharacterized protein n=1 Tax=Acrobeloides nanus TaxID=290746 RepID=A0A914D5F8_9BILA
MSQIAEESLPSTSDSEKVIADNGNAVDDKDYVPDEIVQTSRLEEYEKLFKNCYTMEDEMYAKIANEGIPPVICIFPYETRVTYGGDSYRKVVVEEIGMVGEVIGMVEEVIGMVEEVIGMMEEDDLIMVEIEVVNIEITMLGKEKIVIGIVIIID